MVARDPSATSLPRARPIFTVSVEVYKQISPHPGTLRRLRLLMQCLGRYRLWLRSHELSRYPFSPRRCGGTYTHVDWSIVGPCNQISALWGENWHYGGVLFWRLWSHSCLKWQPSSALPLSSSLFFFLYYIFTCYLIYISSFLYE
jgi:hypothetical protein